jgi:hypothetical protein
MHFSHDVFSLSSTQNDRGMQSLVWLGMVCFKGPGLAVMYNTVRTALHTRLSVYVTIMYLNAKLQARSMQHEGPTTGQLSQVFSGFPRS